MVRTSPSSWLDWRKTDERRSWISPERARRRTRARSSPLWVELSSSAETLLSLVNDILDMERLESGRMEMVLEDCDLMALVDEAIFALAADNLHVDGTLNVSHLIEVFVDEVAETARPLAGRCDGPTH